MHFFLLLEIKKRKEKKDENWGKENSCEKTSSTLIGG